MHGRCGVLERIEVDGFKSLTNFSLELKKGLNILVGPNGAGKSNIILFFEFLSYLATNSAMQATSRVGGAGSVFSLLSDGKLKTEMSFRVIGSGDFINHYRLARQQATPRRQYFHYDYSAKIALSAELSALSFARQTLRVTTHPSEQGALDLEPEAPAIEVDWEIVDGVPHTRVKAADESLFITYMRHGQDKAIDVGEFISQAFSSDFADYCIFASLNRFFLPMESIHDDLVEGRAFNIDPNAVRQPEDIASQPGIRPDGGGLAATLFYSKTASDRPSHGPGYFPLYYRTNEGAPHLKDLVPAVERYAKLINDNFLRLDVESRPFENKLQVALVQRAGSGRAQIRVPMGLVSDGTAKWLALTTAILSRTSAFAIEEPENFLHPHMQTEIVELVRQVCEKKKKRMFAIMTTHSETLLNATDPSEVIVVSMTDGRTRAIRPNNVSELNHEIKATGFGLGYYYLAGALE
jgi:predicted ATPase